MKTTRGTRSRETNHFRRQVTAGPDRPHGYAPLLGLEAEDAAELHARVRDGLPYEALERLRAVLDIPTARLSRLLAIPSRTLGRRKDIGKLDPEESDRLVRLARVVFLALQLFEGDLDEARAWLDSPHFALSHHAPIDFATTEVGAREVEDLVGRLEHGVFL